MALSPSAHRAAALQQLLCAALAAAFFAAADAQMIGHHALENAACSLADFGDRTDEVDAVCCQQAGNPNECGADGAPTKCDRGCSLMYTPWFTECHELIEQFVQGQLAEFDATYTKCQAQDPHDVLRCGPGLEPGTL